MNVTRAALNGVLTSRSLHNSQGKCDYLDFRSVSLISGIDLIVGKYVKMSMHLSGHLVANTLHTLSATLSVRDRHQYNLNGCAVLNKAQLIRCTYNLNVDTSDDSGPYRNIPVTNKTDWYPSPNIWVGFE